MKVTQIFLALAASTASLAFAEPTLNTSGTVSTSNQLSGAKHIYATVEDSGTYKGKAAIWVDDSTAQTTNKNGLANNKHVSFAQIDKTANNFFVKTIANGVLGKDSNGVTVAKLYRMTGAGWSMIPKMPDHSHLGRLSYAKVGDLDAYFGDWADVKSGAADGTAGTNYTVFYSGTGQTTNMPTSGTAVYAVKGINNHVKQGSEILTGNLTADFAKNTLNGSLAKTGLSIAITNATIDHNAASFGYKDKSNAKANNNVVGTAKGHFFGNQAAAIAGIVDFGKNHTFNTAFGGTKK